MKLTQNWVGYLDRSYEQIKRSVLSRLGTVAPELSDHNESNPLIIILSFFAGIAEMLNYYIDNMAREAFISTARLYSSVVRHAYNLDYYPKASQSAMVDLLVKLIDASGTITASTKSITIPKDTILISNNLEYRVLQDATIAVGQNSVVVKAAQFVPELNSNLGTTNGTLFQEIQLPSDYAHGSMVITINGEFWYEYPSFGKMNATTKGFVVVVREDKSIVAVFGNNVYGAVPVTGNAIYGTFKRTAGSNGNVSPNSLIEFSTTINTNQTNLSLSVTNPDWASGGTDIEDIEKIRMNAPARLSTLFRAVTYQDIVQLARMIPGVNDAEVRYCGGKFIDLYVSPSTKGEAPLALLDLVEREFDNNYKMITTSIATKPAGLSRIWIEARVYGRPLYTANELNIDVVDALEAFKGYNASKINGSIILSDLIFELEKLTKVDRVEIAKLRIEPYIRTLAGTRKLDIVFNAAPLSNTTHKYRIIWNTLSSKFLVYKNGSSASAVSSGATFVDGNINITLTNTYGYQNNDEWEFTLVGSYPEVFPAGTFGVSDFSIPYFDIGPLVDADTPKTIYSNITYVEQTIKPNTLPPC